MALPFERQDGEDVSGVPQKKISETPILDSCGRDLIRLAKENKLDPAIGVETHIGQITQILNKRKKNNVLLIGESGVGKSCIVEGLAMLIASKQCDRFFWDKKLIEVNLNSLISKTKYRGEFEGKMKDLIEEVKRDSSIILFLDEIHTIIGAGSASGGMDVANIIKPALARGEFTCIGATTLDDYKKSFESDSALDRRFQKVRIDIPSKAMTVEILEAIKGKYEDFHNVTYEHGLLVDIVELSDRYIPFRNFPDKAIDILDEAGSATKVNSVKIPNNLLEFEKRIELLNSRKLEAADNQDFENAIKLRDEIKNEKISFEKQYDEWKSSLDSNKIRVEKSTIEAIVSKHGGVPVVKITASEKEKYLNIENQLKKSVIGQDDAIIKVSEAIKRAKAGIHDPNKPFVFLFLGTTGVGKTHLAKAVSKFLFDNENSFIRFDMSEFMEKHDASKLIGSPPGYAGFDDKGLLTEKVKHNPYSLILLDEIEKAHPHVFNLLLQAFDEGRLSDSHGTEVNFKNCFFIMTSNIGTSSIVDDNQLGFKKRSDTNDYNEDLVMKDLKKFFKPELINRIDQKVIFNTLTEKDIEKIVGLELASVEERVKSRGVEIKWTKSLIEYLAVNGFDKNFGARPLKRLISSTVENVLADIILTNEDFEGSKIVVDYDAENKKAYAEISK